MIWNLDGDFLTGPQSNLKEEEFFDAVESTLDKQEKDLEERDKNAQDGPKSPLPSDGAMKTQLSVISPAQADDIWEDIEQVRISGTGP